MSFVDIGILRGLLILEDKFSSEIEKAQAKLSNVSKTFKRTGDDLSKLGKSLTMLSLPLAGVGAAAVKMSTDLNTTMANVATMIPKNTERILELKGAVQNMAKDLGKSTQDLAEGLYDVIGTFEDSADAIDQLRISAEAAKAGLATTQEAIGLLAAVTKGYGDTSKEAVQKVADLAFITVNLGKTTFPELAASIGRVVPVAEKLKVSQEELFTVFATLTGVTGNTAEVSTQLASILGGLMKPTDEMTQAIAKLGYSGADAMMKELGLVEALNKLIGTTDGTIESVGALLGRKEALTAAFALTGAQAQTYGEKLKQVSQYSGALASALNEQTNGINKTGNEWQKIQQKFAVAAQQLGDVLIPVLGRATDALMPIIDGAIGLVTALSKLPQPMQTVVVALGGLAMAAGPVIWAVGQLVQAFGIVAGSSLARGVVANMTIASNAIKGVGVSAGVASVAVKAFRTALAGVGVGLLLVGIDILVQKLRDVGKEVETVTGKPLKDLTDGMGKAYISVEQINEVVQRTNNSMLGMGVTIDVNSLRTHKNAGANTAAAAAGESLVAALDAANKKLATLSEEQKKNIAAGLKMGKSSDEVAAALNKLYPGVNVTAAVVQLYGEVLDKTAEKSKKLADYTKDLEKQQRETWNEIGIAQMEAYEQQQKTLEELAAKERQINNEREEARFKAIEANQKMEKDARERASEIQREMGMSDLAFELDQIQRAGQARLNEIDRTVAFWEDAYDAIQAETAASMGQVTAKYKEKIKEMEASTNSFGNIFRKAIGDIPRLIEAAFTGGGGFAGAIKASLSNIGSQLGGKLFEAGGLLNGLGNTMTKGMMNLFGDSIGQAFGLALPGIGQALGSMIGPLMGKVGGWIKGLFGGVSAEVKKVRGEVDTFQKDVLNKMLTPQQQLEAGGEQWRMTVIAVRDAYMKVGRTAAEAEAVVGRLWDTDHPDRARAAMEEINRVLAQQKKLFEEQSAEAADLFTQLYDESLAWGEAFPEHLTPGIEKLIELGMLTEESADKFRELSKAPSWKDMKKAAEELGVSLSALPDSFQNARLQDEFQAVYRNLTILERGLNGDIGGALSASSGKISELIQQALRFGTEVPAGMRKYVEELSRTGQLVDENGQAITDLTHINWAEPMSRSVDRLIEKFDEFLNRVLNVGNALANMPSPNVNVPSGSGGTTPDNADYGGAQAHGGSYTVRQPTWFLAGEAGPERAMFAPVGQIGRSNEVGINVGTIQIVANEGEDARSLALRFIDILRRDPEVRQKMTVLTQESPAYGY